MFVSCGNIKSLLSMSVMRVGDVCFWGWWEGGGGGGGEGCGILLCNVILGLHDVG